MSKPINLVGRKFGKLAVIEEAFRKRNRKRNVFWRCLCDCGAETVVRGADLRNGHTVSCGCSRIDGAIKTAKKNLSKEPRLNSARNVFINRYNDGDLTFEQFFELSQMPCYYCGTLSSNSNSYNKYNRKITVLEDISLGKYHYNGLDRIDNSQKHNIDNVVPCCKWCNSAKMKRSIADFENWIEQIYQTLQKRKGL